MIRKIKRSEFVFFYHKNGQIFDIPTLLSGKINFINAEQIIVFPILHGQELIIGETEFNTLKKISTSKWIENHSDLSLTNDFIKKFQEVGVLLVDTDNFEAQAFIQKENILNTQKWNIYASFFHFLTKWRNVDVQLKTEDYEGNENIDLYHKSMDNVIDKYDTPPTHFHSIKTQQEINLPLIDKSNDSFYETILKRKTGRVYDRNKAISLEKLATILFYTFGCHGIYEMHATFKMVRKTVPSGGSLHPTECYVLCLNIEGLEQGLYHYNIEHHKLSMIKKYTRNIAEEMANKFMAGQNYVRDANALFIMTSRFFRNYWKYQQHTLAYKVTLFDAAHLSQMFYLNCAKENLSSFVTGAINASFIEDELSLNGFEEGATLIVGCGTPLENTGENLLEPSFEKHEIKR